MADGGNIEISPIEPTAGGRNRSPAVSWSRLAVHEKPLAISPDSASRFHLAAPERLSG